MIRFFAVALVLGLTAGSVQAEDPQIGHMVYFTLKDSSPAAQQKLVDACKKYLKDHEGVVHFSTGVVNPERKARPDDVNWQVALHLVFKNKASLSKYVESKTHKQFVEENKDNWEKVRVFDAEIR